MGGATCVALATKEEDTGVHAGHAMCISGPRLRPCHLDFYPAAPAPFPLGSDQQARIPKTQISC